MPPGAVFAKNGSDHLSSLRILDQSIMDEIQS